MVTHDIKLNGPGVKGTVVNAHMLSELLRIVIDGSQRALRVRTQGRSTAGGIVPGWITTSSEFDLQIVEGPTSTSTGSILRIEADQMKSASERDAKIWSVPPAPLKKSTSATPFRVPQGPRSGINAVIGRWPGDEEDDVIEEILETLS